MTGPDAAAGPPADGGGEAAARDLVLVILMASLASMTISLGIPLVSLALEREGYGALAIGLNGAAGGLAIFLIGPFLEPFVARVGAVRAMALALVAAAGLLALFPLRVDPWLWFGLRLLLGCAGGLLFVLTEAAVNALAPPARRARVLAGYATAFSLGYAAGPLILGTVGSEGATPFLVGSGILLLSLPPLLLVRGLDRALRGEARGGGAGGEAGRGDPRRRRATGPLAFLGVARAAPLPFAGVFVYAVIETAFFALLPVFALAEGRGEREATALLSTWLAGNVLFQLPIGWAADRLPRVRVLRLCALGSAALLLAAWALPAGSPLRWPVFLLMGGGTGALYTLSLTFLGDRFGPAELTRANTAYVMTFHLGLIAGPVAVGAVMQATAPAALLPALAVPLLALAAASVQGGLGARPSAAAARGSPAVGAPSSRGP